MSGCHCPRPPCLHGEQPRSLAGRHFIQTQVRTDVFLRIREVMERHNLSTSRAVHPLLRERFRLPPPPTFDQHLLSKDIVRSNVLTASSGLLPGAPADDELTLSGLAGGVPGGAAAGQVPLGWDAVG